MSFLKPLTLACAALLPTTALADWNGLYAGGSLGSVSNLSYEITANIDPDAEFDDTTSFGAFFGSHNQTGGFVLGYELALEFLSDATALSDGAAVDYLLDLKVSAGAPIGDALVYGLISVSAVNGNYFTNDIGGGGFGIGAGMAYKVTDSMSVGAEYITRTSTTEFVETDVDATADSFNARVSFHF